MLLADYEEYSVPRVIEHLSTKRVLTTTFAHGIPLEELMRAEVSQEIRNWVFHFTRSSFLFAPLPSSFSPLLLSLLFFFLSSSSFSPLLLSLLFFFLSSSSFSPLLLS